MHKKSLQTAKDGLPGLKKHHGLWWI